ncbi:MAG: translocated intimin receptor Tir [bacterium]|nr:translocated intimin receptor Tir [bacterium]
MEEKQNYSMIKAVLTDIQFWIPVGILIIGILILTYVA